MHDEEVVVLLDEQLRPTGTAAKSTIHTANTPLHLAFSCYVMNTAGQLLLTRRATTKLTWPGVWTNSFCGHPGPNELPEEAIARRAETELGLVISEPRCVLPSFRYRAVDASGVVENEFCPVYVANCDAEPIPNPAEVAEHVWLTPAEAAAAIAHAPFAFSPWLHEQLPEVHHAIDSARGIIR